MQPSAINDAPWCIGILAILARNLRQNAVFRAIDVIDRCSLSKSREMQENGHFTSDSSSGNVALGV